MVSFLANRGNIRVRQLHRRITNRFRSDSRFGTVRLRASEEREPGPYRVVAEADPRQLVEESSYPGSKGRIETGFRLLDDHPHEHCWCNWIEPDRDLLVGWHRDRTHPDLGPTHLQVTHAGRTVAREAARFVDEHPMAVVEARLQQLPGVLERVEWEDGRVVGIDW